MIYTHADGCVLLSTYQFYGVLRINALVYNQYIVCKQPFSDMGLTVLLAGIIFSRCSLCATTMSL